MRTLLVVLLPALLLLGCASDDSGTPAEPNTGEATTEAPAAALLNANLATEAELAAVDGLGASGAAALFAARPLLDALQLDAALQAAGVENRESIYAQVFVPINLNHASEEEIRLVPGVGDRMTREFQEYRPYVEMAQFRREMGKYVDDPEVERLAGYVFVPVDLNTASEEQIMALPGVGARMAHEFDEYRPWVDMAQFRREIGKYVDDAELARLERFVEIRGNE